MKKLLPAFVILSAFAAPSFAGPCVALDYQEMKDMPVEELLNEACKARAAMGSSYDEIEINLGAPIGRKPFPNAQENFDQCNGQSTRIDRVLVTKGMSNDQIAAACRAKRTEAQRQK